MTFFRFNPFSRTHDDETSPKKPFYRLISIGLVIVLIGVAIYNVYTYYEAQERLRIVNARTEMVKAQAKNNQLTILSEDKIKEIAALNTGVPLEELRFTEIGLITFEDLPMPPMFTNKPPLNKDKATTAETMGQSNLPEDKNSDTSLPPIQMPPDAQNMHKNTQHKMTSSKDNPISSDASATTKASNMPSTSNTSKQETRAISANGEIHLGPPPHLPENDFSRTPPGEFKKHPLYHIFAKSSGLTYELIIDSVNGRIIKSNVY